MKKVKTYGKFILQGTKVVPCNDLFEWAMWLESNREPVRRDFFDGGYVTTIFFGLDLNCGLGTNAPHVFETMAFLTDRQAILVGRWATWADAVEGHERFLKELEKGSDEQG